MNPTLLWKKGVSKLRRQRSTYLRTKKINSYIQNGRRPWTEGYDVFKEDFIKRVIHDESVINLFQKNLNLPEKYGEFIDERVVEYPWLISRLNKEHGTLLDAGSILNFSYLTQHPLIKQKETTIVTLEPEANCYWKQRISYLYADLRNLPLKNDYFDEVASISTLEHIGMNNSIYSSNATWQEQKPLDFLKAIAELNRVLKPGGKAYITVPYGQYTNFGWYQQFDADLINRLIEAFEPANVVETYFCYESGGWQFSDKSYCQRFEGFNIHDTKYVNPESTKDYDPDFAACSRAIAALELWK